MRKHKSVVAMLLAVMMVLAFMPTMAFAADTVEWASDYSTVKVNGTEYSTTRTFGSDGMVTATLNAGDTKGAPTATTKYYDFNNAVIAEADGQAIASTYTSFSQWADPTGLIFSAPSYVTNTSAAKVFVALSTLNGGSTQDWVGAFTYKQDGETVTAVANKGTADTTVEVALNVTYNVSATTKLAFVGAVASKTATIKGASKGTVPTTLAGNLYIDSSKTAETSADISKAYDGKEHTVAAAAVKGFTVKYTVFNEKTGAWDAVDAVTFKDAAAKVNARATYYDDSKASDSTYKGETPLAFSVTVTASTKSPTIAWTADTAGLAKTKKLVAGQYDAWDYVVLSNAEVEADKEALLAYFKAAYTIEETASSTFDSTAYNWTFKAVDPAPKAADYAILANYAAPTAPAKTALPVVITESAALGSDYEVEFTSVPDGAKVYHVKKAKALKKAKSFTVKAEAANGATVTYKLINAPAKIKINKTTGKITLKKGLKKGTYKFKVKAYVAGQQSGTTGYEVQSITVKIKK